MKNLVTVVVVFIVTWALFTNNIIMTSASIQTSTMINNYVYVNTFLNQIADKGSITGRDFMQLNVDLAKSGVIYDYTLQVQKRVVYKNKVDYLNDTTFDKSNAENSTKLYKLDRGDRLILTIEKKSKTNSESILSIFTGGVNLNQRIVSYVVGVR